MQRRLLISMIAVAVAAVLALGIPLAIAISRLQVNEGSQQLHRDALLAANQLQQQLNTGLPPDAKQARRLLHRPLRGDQEKPAGWSRARASSQPRMTR